MTIINLAPVVQRLDNAIQRINVDKTNHAIHWIVIYPVDSVIHFLNNWGLINLPSRCRVSVLAWSFQSNLWMKNAPEECFYGPFFAFFMQNLFLLHQQLVVVFVARIHLLWTLEVLIQLRICRHRSRFHLYWIFPRPAESWFKIHLH